MSQPDRAFPLLSSFCWCCFKVFSTIRLQRRWLMVFPSLKSFSLNDPASVPLWRKPHQYSMPDARRLGIRRTSAGGSVVTMMDDLLKIMLWGNAMQWWHIGFDLEPLSWRYSHCVLITMKRSPRTWAWRWSIPPMSALLPPCGFSPTSPLLWLLTRKIFLLY